MGDLNAFREDARRWLDEHAPPSMRTPPASADEVCWGGKKGRYPDETRRWLALMAERGWTAPTWPREYGGGGLSKEEAKVVAEEMAKQKLRPALIGFGLEMIGPLLLQTGNEEQKREHLPRIARGEIRWCQPCTCRTAGRFGRLRVTGRTVCSSSAAPTPRRSRVASRSC
jgi:acyl-CoA dehydrogenase